MPPLPHEPPHPGKGRRCKIEKENGMGWHQPNLVDCIRSRKAPNADIAICHYSASLVHLGNLAYRAGKRLLTFDGESERFTDNAVNDKFLMPNHRKEFLIPEKV
jgi:hypothetical protein